MNNQTGSPERIDRGATEAADDDKRMALVALGIAVIGVAALLFADVSRSVMLPLGVVLCGAFVLAWRGILAPARVLVPLAGLMACSILMFINNGLRDTAMLGMFAVVVAAGLLVGRWGTVLVGGLAMLVVAALGVAETAGWVHNLFSAHNQPADYLTVAVGILVVTLLQWTVITRLNDNVHRVRRELAERRAAERALRESEALYESLVAAMPLSLLRKDTQGRITFANQKYCQAFQTSLAELIGKTDFDLHPRELADQYSADDRRVIETNQAIELVEEHTPLGGATSYVQVFKTPVYDAAGKIVGIQIMFWDMTKRKRAENALTESQARNQALLKAIPDMMFELAGDGTFLSFVPAQTTQPLAPPEQFIGKHVRQVLPAQVAQLTVQAIARVLESGEVQHFEYRLAQPDGVHDYEARLTQSGEQRVLSIIREITARKRMEQALAQRVAELRALHEASLDLGARSDVSTLLQVIARHAAKLLGVPRSSIYLLQPDQTLELVVRFNLPLSYRGVRLQMGEGVAGRVAQTGKPLVVEDYRHWEGRARIFDDNAPSRVLGVPLQTRARMIGVLNVTDAEQAGSFDQAAVQLLSLFADQAAIAIENAQLQQETQKRAEQLATMNEIGSALTGLRDLDNVLEIIYQQSQRVAPVEAFYICLYDQAHAQISFPILYDQGKRYAEPTMSLLPGTQLATVLDQGKPLITHRTAEELATPVQHGLGDAQRKSASILIVPLRRGERVIGALSVQSYALNVYTEEHAKILTGIGHQVAIAIENAKLFTAAQQELADRKRAQADREALIQELETKNAELERFTYTVSHDLKSPLITIQGFLGFVEQDAQKGNLPRLQADIARITEATKKMAQLLNELLELSRIGRMMNPPEDVPFVEIVRAALALVRGSLDAAKVRVVVAVDLPIICGDRTRLIEVIQNLIDNAIKFMGAQPDPQIDIGWRGVAADGKLIFCVRDNGVGIDPQYHAKVFGLFNKLDAQSEGTGVGLALVKRIVQVHGGDIWIESEPGKGAAFLFTLPGKAKGS